MSRFRAVPVFISSVLLWIFTSSVAEADVRVLVRFDTNGHRVHRLDHLESSQSVSLRNALLSQNQVVNERSAMIDAGGASVQWFNSAGSLLLTEHLLDPRLVHEPTGSGLNRSSVTFVVRTEGAYLLRGPQAAKSVVVVLPAIESVVLSLQSEYWTLDVQQP